MAFDCARNENAIQSATPFSSFLLVRPNLANSSLFNGSNHLILIRCSFLAEISLNLFLKIPII